MSGPTTIGRYEIVRELGRGAMGRVYLARDPVIDRLVALKTFRRERDPGLAEARRRLLREARAAAAFSHPNVVTIFDVLETEDGGVALAMEYVQGTTLEERLRDGNMELGAVVRTVTQIAEALDHIHARGLVHRDLKPANVLISGDGVVKLTDFGIAQPGHPAATLSESLFATPQYMSPEIARGEPADRRSDIFSLGVLVYEMLTGSLPFPGDSVSEVARQIAYEPFDPPPDLETPLGEEVTAVLTRALEKNPADRYATAGGVARALRGGSDASTAVDEGALTRALIDDRLAPTVRVSRWRRWLRRLRLRPVLRALALVAILLAVGSAGVWLGRQAHRPSPEVPTDYTHLPLIQEGRRLLADGEPAAAALLFGAAERVAPDPQAVAALRLEAERRVAEEGAKKLVLKAREAMTERRYEEVLEIVQLLVESEAGSDEAIGVLEQVAASLSVPEAVETPPSAARPTGRRSGPGGAPRPAEVATGEATLLLEVASEAPKGVLTLYAGGRQVYRERFSFHERRGFLGLLRKPSSGRLDDSLQLPAGRTDILALVARPGQQGQGVKLAATLRAGGRHRLQISVPEEGRPAASLE